MTLALRLGVALGTTPLEYARPYRTLDLNMQADAIDSRITFTRASAATYVNSAGVITSATTNTPRIDYDPVTLACKGLLIEEARTRLNTASLLPVIAQNVTVTAVAHTISFYGTGTVTLSGTSTAGPLVGTGAYPNRVTLTFTPTAGTLTLTPSGSVNDLQLEIGTFATSIIRGSEGSQVTRAADVAVMTGGNFSDWYSATAGTFVIEGDGISDASARYAFSINDGGLNEFFGVRTNGNLSSVGIDGGVLQWALVDSYTSQASFKSALAFAVNDIAFVANGGAVQTDGAATLATVTRMDIGTGPGLPLFCGHIRRIAFYSTRLPNATLQALSA